MKNTKINYKNENEKIWQVYKSDSGLKIHKSSEVKNYTSISLESFLEKTRNNISKHFFIEIRMPTNITDEDLKIFGDEKYRKLKGRMTLSIGSCNRITDKAFEYLKGIHTLNMPLCFQKEITDKAFEYLKGIHNLDMGLCFQKEITDKAFEYLKGIHTLNMESCNQETITNKAFPYLAKIPNLKIESYNPDFIQRFEDYKAQLQKQKNIGITI